MLVADVVRFGAQGTVALLVLTHSAHVWELVVLQAISGTATAFFNPASTGLTPLTVSPERLQQANALRGLAMASTGIVGSALSGVLVVTVGPGWALAIDSLTFAVSAFFLAQLRLPPQVTLPPQSFLRDLRDGWHEVASRTWVWTIVLAASVGNMMVSIFVVLGAVISKADPRRRRRLGGDRHRARNRLAARRCRRAAGAASGGRSSSARRWSACSPCRWRCSHSTHPSW